MEKKKIYLSFDLEQVCNDILAKCNLVGLSIRDAALEDIKANVQEPDSDETRSIICRAVTEAFGKVKVACQRYLMKGRTTDSNVLERLVSSYTRARVETEVQARDVLGRLLFTYDSQDVYQDGGTWYHSRSINVEEHTENRDPVTIAEGTAPVAKMTTTFVEGDIESMTFEVVHIDLEIANFNTAVTDHLKSAIHKYVVDYVMGRFLQDQVKDKADEYKAIAEGEDYADIVSDLNARERYTMRKASWI